MGTILQTPALKGSQETAEAQHPLLLTWGLCVDTCEEVGMGNMS